MTSATLTLTEFLLARIAEDEEWGRFGDGTDPLPSGYWDNDRVLAECEAKRRIVEDVHFDGRSGDYVAPWCAECSDDENLAYLPCPTLRLLALPYVDHPDYCEGWRP